MGGDAKVRGRCLEGAQAKVSAASQSSFLGDHDGQVGGKGEKMVLSNKSAQVQEKGKKMEEEEEEARVCEGVACFKM
jgi:hypothetical protein